MTELKNQLAVQLSVLFGEYTMTQCQNAAESLIPIVEAQIETAHAGALLAAAERARQEGAEWVRVHQDERNLAAKEACENIEHGILALTSASGQRAIERIKAEARETAFEQCRKLLIAQGSDTCLAGAAIIERFRDDARTAVEQLREGRNEQ
jgi:hypothetical protein